MEFRLVQSKRPLFMKCMDSMDMSLYRKVGKDIYIQMNWERLLLFGSDTQIKHFNRVRETYINHLLKKYVKKIYECNVKMVGSKSPKSDIDINLICQTHFQEVFQNIHTDHHRQYPNSSLNELFDVNIYGKVYHYLTPLCDEVHEKLLSCYPRRHSSYKQRQWSFMRIVEVLEYVSNEQKRLFLQSLPTIYQELYKDTLHLYKNTKQYYKKHDYGYSIEKYRDLLKQTRPKASPEAIANAFSTASFIEIDSYRSIGAYLHIVEKLSKLPKTVLYDSIYDNLGFIYQILLNNHLCLNEQTVVLLVKTCKYIERITNAMMQIIDKPSKQLLRIHELSNLINLKRKQMVSIPLLQKEMESFMVEFNIHTLSKVDLLMALTQFIIDTLPRDPLLKSHE